LRPWRPLARPPATAPRNGRASTCSTPRPNLPSSPTRRSSDLDQTIDFGFYQPASVGDFVWNDLNGNGVQDGGEPGINGVTLTLSGTTDAADSVTQHATTIGNRGDPFSGLAPGTYTLSLPPTNL